MSSITKSSSSRTSSSSFRSSSRYSCSSVSSTWTEGSTGTDRSFPAFLDRRPQVLFGEDPLSLPAFSNHPRGPYLPNQADPEGTFSTCSGDLSPFGSYNGDRESFGSYGSERESFGGYQGDRKSCSGGYQGDWSHRDDAQATSGQSARVGAVQMVGNSYYFSADVSQFEPHDVVVMAYNHSVVIHAEKVGDDGSIRDKFIHKSLLPEDMDPLSVNGTLTPEGTLVISVKRNTKPLSNSLTSNFHSEGHQCY
ncbi:hypothetical protein AMEX_G21700 [Astyanax mexicanus]|uniref:Uncharacterized LOC103033175 n=2 Tax=Astyanax mexicanus TaxID=7994 RepID=A0A8B9JK41_ASTMX|nr:hypothetical protein AMEX_G21700 [Astyanax mexicanus]